MSGSGREAEREERYGSDASYWDESRLLLVSRSPALLFDPKEMDGRQEQCCGDPRVCAEGGERNSCVKRDEAREERGERGRGEAMKEGKKEFRSTAVHFAVWIARRKQRHSQQMSM